MQTFFLSINILALFLCSVHLDDLKFTLTLPVLILTEFDVSVLQLAIVLTSFLPIGIVEILFYGTIFKYSLSKSFLFALFIVTNLPRFIWINVKKLSVPLAKAIISFLIIINTFISLSLINTTFTDFSNLKDSMS